jgi:cytidylate kinase
LVGAVIIGVVGPCCAGKSTLVQALAAHGCAVRHIAQEHSYAPKMWQIIGKADLLVFLDVSYEVAQSRRWMDWLPRDIAEQQHRLRDARLHCDLYVDTNALTTDDVFDLVFPFVTRHTDAAPLPQTE